MSQATNERADALALEVLTPETEEKIEQVLRLLRDGHDPYLSLRLLYGLAYMDGMLAMAKVGTPQ